MNEAFFCKPRFLTNNYSYKKSRNTLCVFVRGSFLYLTVREYRTLTIDVWELVAWYVYVIKSAAPDCIFLCTFTGNCNIAQSTLTV